MEGPEPIISTRGLCRYFKQGDITIRALHEVDMSVHKGEWLAITGASGSGKSTLLNMLGLLDDPTGGEVFLYGRPTRDLGQKEKAKLRLKGIGFIFQFFNLQTNLTALENVMLPAWLATGNRTRSLEKARVYLKRVGLGDRMEHTPARLSGGQQQRVAIARALINEPGLILADEPTGNLDSGSSKGIMELFSEIEKEGHTILMVTHEKDIASAASREIRLHDGNLFV